MTETTPPIRVALVLQDLEFGGAQRQALRLAAHLDKTRFATELWVMCPGGGLVPEACGLGIPVRFLSRKKKVGPLALIRLWSALRLRRPDIVTAFTAVPNIWCRVFGRIAGIPVIVGTCRGGGSIERQKERLLWRLAHHHICNASPLRSALVEEVGVPGHRVSLCANGIDVPAPPASPASGSPKHVLSVGRLVEDKDQATLFKAFALALRAHHDARLTLVGDGELGAELRRLAESLGIGGSVEFLPGRPDLTGLYASCAFFALSSCREALPNVLLEAAAAGRAVVSTRVGGIPDIVVHEKTGLLVDSGSPEQMAEAMSRLLGDAGLCRTMGEAGRERIKANYGVAGMVQCHASIFTRLYKEMKG